MTRSYAGPSPFCLFDTFNRICSTEYCTRVFLPRFPRGLSEAPSRRLKETIVRLCLRRPVLWSHRKQLREGQ